MIFLTCISSLLFTGGIVAYWIVSQPLSELPNWNQLQAMKEKKESHN